MQITALDISASVSTLKNQNSDLEKIYTGETFENEYSNHSLSIRLCCSKARHIIAQQLKIIPKMTLLSSSRLFLLLNEMLLICLRLFFDKLIRQCYTWTCS